MYPNLVNKMIGLSALVYKMSHGMRNYNNVVYATSKVSDQPAHTCSLIRAFAS